VWRSLALSSTFRKSAIEPFWIDSTVTWSLNPFWALFASADGGTQATVAAWPKPRCVPGAVRRPAPLDALDPPGAPDPPGAAGVADAADAAAGAVLPLDVPPDALPLHAARLSPDIAAKAHAASKARGVSRRGQPILARPS
jgi:hypothetical protein